MSIDLLVAQVEEQLKKYQQQNLRLFASSSFQTHSLPMLHLIGRFAPETPILFINTGFHFPETLLFRDTIAEQFNLNVVDVKSDVPKNLQRNSENQFYFTSDPDYCCFLNKTQPLKFAMADYDVWINGIRKDQNANRKNMRSEEQTPDGKMRYHPMLDWSNKLIYEYRKLHQLPEHPLEAKGYFSVGCEPCTRKMDVTSERHGRWFGMKKTECGLHTELVQK